MIKISSPAAFLSAGAPDVHQTNVQSILLADLNVFIQNKAENTSSVLLNLQLKDSSIYTLHESSLRTDGKTKRHDCENFLCKKCDMFVFGCDREKVFKFNQRNERATFDLHHN